MIFLSFPALQVSSFAILLHYLFRIRSLLLLLLPLLNFNIFSFFIIFFDQHFFYFHIHKNYNHHPHHKLKMPFFIKYPFIQFCPMKLNIKINILEFLEFLLRVSLKSGVFEICYYFLYYILNGLYYFQLTSLKVINI